ncbi:MAG TPA: HAMP domain-containing sensor histidine kinase [Ktedonobacterales bacterium]|nr:HAMP domain-containing sensor histidine kinase [Ktedonobacterales bacterium]
MRDLAAAPFSADPEALLSRSPVERLRDRQAALLRLVLLSVVVLVAGMCIPAAALGRASGLLIAVAAAAVILSLTCLAFNRLGQSTLAASFFILGAIAVGVCYVQAGPQVQTIVVPLVYALMSLLVLMAGILLPPGFVWPTAALVLAATVLGLSGVGTRPRDSAALALLVAFEVLVTVLSWIAARSAAAGAQAASVALDRVRELTALKDQFLIDANHELRTPMMSWYGNTELLAQLGTHATPEQRERMLARALASGDAVLRLLNSLLDAGALGAGPPRLRIELVVLEPLIRDVLATFDPRQIGEPGLEEITYEAPRVTLDVSPGLTALADASRLRQVLVNLLTNALKYSAPGTPIIITAQPLSPPDRTRRRPLRMRGRRSPAIAGPAPMVRIAVRDRGLGVPPRDAGKLFQRFVRLERDIAGSVRGTGVGLYLCRVLVEAMGGRIWVESTGIEGEGSTFALTLPLAAPSQEAALPPQAEDAAPIETVGHLRRTPAPSHPRA